MPKDWFELEHLGYGTFDKSEELFYIEGTHVETWAIPVKDYHVGFGIAPQDVTTKQGVIVTSRNGVRCWLMKSLKDNWLVGDLSEECQDFSLKIYRALTNGSEK